MVDSYPNSALATSCASSRRSISLSCGDRRGPPIIRGLSHLAYYCGDEFGGVCKSQTGFAISFRTYMSAPISELSLESGEAGVVGRRGKENDNPWACV